VNDLLHGTRRLWLEINTGPPEWLPRSLLPRLNDIKELVRLAVGPALPVSLLEGENAAGRLRATLVNVPFQRKYLESTLFSGALQTKEMGKVPFWHLDALPPDQLGDLLIVGGSKHLIRSLPTEGAVVLPQSVNHVIDLSGGWDQVRGRFHRDVRENALRMIRKYGYEFNASHSWCDFDRFFNNMYVPTMNNRHGEVSWPMDRQEAEIIFAHGFLLQVKRGEDWVAAALCECRADSVFGHLIGVQGANQQLIEEGAISAPYYGLIKWAIEQGYRTVSPLGSPPFMDSGMFRHKRRWGTAVGISESMNRDLWLRVVNATPAVKRFFVDNPLVAFDSNYDLQGTIFVEDSMLSADVVAVCQKKYATPGLHRLEIRSVTELNGSNGDGVIMRIPVDDALTGVTK
jgi:hypothetical protein